MAKSFFLGASHAAAYARYRPIAPQQLTDKILHYLQEKIAPPFTSAVDVGCGSGQSTLNLCPHFQHVLGTDVSQNQLALARKLAEGVNNVAYSVSRAEELAVENGTVQLITASQCFHWLDGEKFYQEAKRVLVPNGVLAIYAYLVPKIITDNEEKTQKVYEHLMKLYEGPLECYWDPARKMVDQRYDTVRLPFSDALRINGIIQSKTCTVADFHGYLSSWSSYQNYGKDKGEKAADELLKQFIRRLLEILQSPKSAEETVVRLDTEYFLLLGRNSDSPLVPN